MSSKKLHSKAFISLADVYLISFLIYCELFQFIDILSKIKCLLLLYFNFSHLLSNSFIEMTVNTRQLHSNLINLRLSRKAIQITQANIILYLPSHTRVIQLQPKSDYEIISDQEGGILACALWETKILLFPLVKDKLMLYTLFKISICS